MIDACQLALHVDKPVKLIWTREDDVRSGRFRPASVQRLSATLDDQGRIATWRHWMAGTGRALISTGARLPHYAIEHRDIRAQSTEIGIRTRSWRAEGHNANKFAIESFIDEIADHVGIDPLDYRRAMIGPDQRARNVLDRVAKMAGWGKPTTEGRALGLSFAERGSITACVVELSLNDSRDAIRVHRVWMAVDAGLVVQPDNALAQIEGSVIMAISSTLQEKITIKDGVVQESNFHDYPLLKMAQSPASIEVEFIQSNEPPVGIGEAGLPAVGAR